jgi:hypothetical protein
MIFLMGLLLFVVLYVVAVYEILGIGDWVEKRRLGKNPRAVWPEKGEKP